MRDQYPGRVVAFKEPFKNIMQHTHFFLDPRQLWRLFLSSTMKAQGVYFGTDKIGHFTDMGMHYYRAFNKAKESGASDDAAIKKALCREAGKDRTFLRKVRPWWGHNYHFHVRIGCQPGSTESTSNATNAL